MITRLLELRQNARKTPEAFLQSHPLSWLRYADDSPNPDPAKTHLARSFDPTQAKALQSQGLGAFYTLQSFGTPMLAEELSCYRQMGIVVTLVRKSELLTLPIDVIERRKTNYLMELLSFSEQPHYLSETLTGFELVYRVMPTRVWPEIANGIALNAQLIAVLGGDLSALSLTQSMRLPGTLDLRRPTEPFACRLLWDRKTTEPYSWNRLRQAIAASRTLISHFGNEHC